MSRWTHIPTFFAAIILLNACSGTAGGPHSWMDYPLENSTFPLEPLTLISHASDKDGVAIIEFYVDGKEQISITADGNELEWREWEWNPPALGTYLVGARGTDSNGNAGTIATSTITITGELVDIPEEEEDPIQEAAAPVDEMPAADAEEAAAAIVVPHVVAKKDSNCREGSGTAFDIYGILLEAEEAEITGRLADNFWLRVAIEGRSRDCWISSSIVDVVGDLDEIAVIAAPAAPDPAEAPSGDDQQDDSSDDDQEDDSSDDDQQNDSSDEGDTTPPSFDLALSGNPISYTDEVDSIVLAFDESGIKKISATWKLQGTDKSGSANYAPIPDYEGAYFITLGPFNESGTLKINGTIVDKAGNKATFSQTVQVE